MKMILNNAFGILDKENPLDDEGKTFEVVVTIDRAALDVIRYAMTKYAKEAEDLIDIEDAVDLVRAIRIIHDAGRCAARTEFQKAAETSNLAHKVDKFLDELKEKCEKAGGEPNADAFIRLGAVLNDLKRKGAI